MIGKMRKKGPSSCNAAVNLSHGTQQPEGYRNNRRRVNRPKHTIDHIRKARELKWSKQKTRQTQKSDLLSNPEAQNYWPMSRSQMAFIIILMTEICQSSETILCLESSTSMAKFVIHGLQPNMCSVVRLSLSLPFFFVGSLSASINGRRKKDKLHKHCRVMMGFSSFCMTQHCKTSSRVDGHGLSQTMILLGGLRFMEQDLFVDFRIAFWFMLIYMLKTLLFTNNLIDKPKALTFVFTSFTRKLNLNGSSSCCHILIEYTAVAQRESNRNSSRPTKHHRISSFVVVFPCTIQIIQTTIILNVFAAVHDWYSSSHSVNHYSCHWLASSFRCYCWHCSNIRRGAQHSAVDKLDNFEWFVARPCTLNRDLML